MRSLSALRRCSGVRGEAIAARIPLNCSAGVNTCLLIETLPVPEVPSQLTEQKPPGVVFAKGGAKTMRRFGAQYCEYFGTKKEQRVQREFYKKDYFKYLWTWGAFEDKRGRIHVFISAPANSLRAKSVRGIFKEAAKILPHEHRGGRPHSVQPHELPRLRTQVENFAIERGTVSSAVRKVAEREGMDPRTLKTALGKLLPGGQAHVMAVRRKKKETQRVPKRDDHTPLGRHYRRNAIGSFDEVS